MGLITYCLSHWDLAPRQLNLTFPRNLVLDFSTLSGLSPQSPHVLPFHTLFWPWNRRKSLQTMLFPCFSYVFPMFFPCFSHGFPMFFQTFLPAFSRDPSWTQADLLQEASRRQRRFMLREKRRARRFWRDGVVKLVEKLVIWWFDDVLYGFIWFLRWFDSIWWLIWWCFNWCFN